MPNQTTYENKMNYLVLLFASFIGLFIRPCFGAFDIKDLSEPGSDGLKGPWYPLRLEPFYDNFNIPSALLNKNYVKFQLKCVFFGGPCDLVGKFLKPRAISGLFGKCLACTEYQKDNLGNWLLLLFNRYPFLARAAVIKYCLDIGIDVPENEIAKLAPLLS